VASGLMIEKVRVTAMVCSCERLLLWGRIWRGP
jgi:hypothetical protein